MDSSPIDETTIQRALESMRQTSAWNSERFYDLSLPAALRERMAASCFVVTMEHADAIAILVDFKPPALASAFALVRAVFESYVRGLWLHDCASDTEVAQFSTDALRPKMFELVRVLEKAGSAGGSRLEQVYRQDWDALCAYAHTGAHQVQRWNTEKAIEPIYKPAEVFEVLTFAHKTAILAARGLAMVASREDLMNGVLVRHDALGRLPLFGVS